MYRILSSLLAIVILSIVSWQAFREGNYLGGALAAAGIIGLTGLIFYFINTTNRKLTYFFSALENDDYTIRFVEKFLLFWSKHLKKSVRVKTGE